MNRIIRKSLLFVLSLCFVLSLGCFALFSPVKTQVGAEGDYDADAFEMEYGAQLKLTGDGMRFIVKMGSNKYEKIVGSDDITLSFLIAPKSYFDAVDEGANAGKYENLSKKIQIDIPDEKIYTHDGYYYANGVIQNLDENNNPALKNGSQYDYEFVATAMIKDKTGATETEYAAFNGGDMANNTRTQYDIIQAAVLNEDKDVASALMNSETSPYKSWFGTDAHPLRVDTVEKYELYKALVAAGCDFGTCNVNPRTEEENKTLFLFDRELGAKQITSTDASAIAFDPAKHMQGGNGSLKITFSNKEEPVVAYNTLGFTGLTSGKYVVFYAYNDTNADYIDLALRTTQRFRLHKGEWSMVIWTADGIAASENEIKFYGYNYGEGDYKGSTSVNITGNVYFTKAQVLDSSESEIAHMPTSAGENSYRVGNTALTAASWYQNGAYNSDSVAFNSVTYGKIYYADGALRAHALAPNTQAEGAGNATPYLTLDTPVAFAGNIMYITMKGAEEDYIYAQVFKDGGGHEGTPNGYVDKVYEDGFVRYAFPFLSTWSGELKSFRLFALRNLKYPHMGEIIIRDITITSISSVAAEKRAEYDTGVIGLFDDPIGVTQVSKWAGSGFSPRYTREKHIEGETGSLKITYSDAVEPSAIQISNRYDYTLESGKYVVFYMYNDTNAKRIDIALDTTSRVCVYRGEWVMICYESAAMNDANFVLRFYGYLFDDSATTFTGSIYFSRVKVLNSDKVKDATADADCTIGHTTFTGGITYDGNGDYGDVGTGRGFADSPFYRYPYMVDGVLRTIIRSGDSGESTTPKIVLTLKDPVKCYDDTALYITMKGADDTAASSVYAQIFCNGSHVGTPTATVVETLADGYYVYRFDLSVYKNEAPITCIRLHPHPHPRCLNSDWWMDEVRISDINITSPSSVAAEQRAAEKRAEYDTDVIGFFDDPLGVAQVSVCDGSGFVGSYTTEKHIEGETGSLEINYSDAVEPSAIQISYRYGYTLESGKYVVFYMYNDTNAKRIDIALGTTSRVCVYRGEWTMICYESAAMNDANFVLRFYGYLFDDSATTFTGSIYFSRVKVLNSEKVQNATENADCTIGHTTFTGGITYYGNGDYGDVGTGRGFDNSPFYRYPYMVDGVLRTIIRSGDGGESTTPMIVLTLKEAVQWQDYTALYITMKGADDTAASSVYAQIFCNGSHVGTPTATVVETLADGYYVYRFDLSVYKNEAPITCIRLHPHPHPRCLNSDWWMDEIRISDITITFTPPEVAEKRAGYDTDVIGLFDDPIGVTQVSTWDGSEFVGSYTTEKHIEGETGSLEITYSGASNESAIQISNRYGYTLESGKYVVFYMYNDTNAQRIDIALGTTHRVCVYRGEWVMICYESAAMNDANFVLRFYGYLFDDSATTFTGSIYFSRVKVLNSDKVKDATADADCTIGHTTFTGGITYYENGDYGYNRGFADSPFYSDPYMVDGVLRTILRSGNSGESTTPMIVLTLKDAVQCYDDTALYITMKGADDTAASSVYAQIFCNGSHVGTPTATVVETLADGYYVYRFDLSGYKNEAPITCIRLHPHPHPRALDSDWWMDEIRISDITITSLSTLVDFFVDVPEGRDIVVLQITDTQIIDSDTMRRSDRLDATSISSYSNKTYDSMEKYCFKYLREMIDEVKPDFIIMTGDNTYGEFDDDGHILLRLIEVMESFEIPWAPVFGNHDLETNKGADWYSEQYENAEYCCFKQRTLSGNGNYTVGIRQGGELKRLFVMLDSEGCSKVSQMSLANGHTNTERGFKQDQIEWYTDTITKIKNFVPTVKISFAYHIQMEMAFKALRETYGSNLFPQYDEYVEIDPILSIDRVIEKQASDFGFVNEMGPAWDSDFTIYNGIKALGVDSMFLGHCHTNCYSVVYDGIRFQFGLKSSRHDFLAIVDKSTGDLTQGFWLDTDDDKTGSCPIIGGTVIPLSQDNGEIKDPYIYYCTGAGKEVDWSQWNNTISTNDDWSSHYTEY